MKLASFVILSVIVISGCVQPQQPESPEAVIEGREHFDISFPTEDGFNIYGTFYPNEGKPGVILLHMLGNDRKSWDRFASLLKDYAVLSIDLRGHGESTDQDGSNIVWTGFSEEDYKNMVLDTEAAKDYIIDEYIDSGRIAIIGASIGANTALNYAAADDEVKAVVLLSPGLDYRGVKTTEAIKVYKNNLLIVASEEDQQAAIPSRTLHDASPANKELKMYSGLGHGTDMLFKADMNDYILTWLSENL